jgi:hypothetical protein
MVSSKATTVKDYLAELSPERRKAISAVRKVIRANLDKGFVEGMQWGMICYSVPLKIYPAGYLDDKKTPLPYAALASQKNYMSVYLSLYSESAKLKWFKKAYAATGKKLNMGKSCIRFKKLDDLPLEVIGEGENLSKYVFAQAST